MRRKCSTGKRKNNRHFHPSFPSPPCTQAAMRKKPLLPEKQAGRGEEGGLSGSQARMGFFLRRRRWKEDFRTQHRRQRERNLRRKGRGDFWELAAVFLRALLRLCHGRTQSRLDHRQSAFSGVGRKKGEFSRASDFFLRCSFSRRHLRRCRVVTENRRRIEANELRKSPFSLLRNASLPLSSFPPHFSHGASKSFPPPPSAAGAGKKEGRREVPLSSQHFFLRPLFSHTPSPPLPSPFASPPRCLSVGSPSSSGRPRSLCLGKKAAAMGKFPLR